MPDIYSQLIHLEYERQYVVALAIGDLHWPGFWASGWIAVKPVCKDHWGCMGIQECPAFHMGYVIPFSYRSAASGRSSNFFTIKAPAHTHDTLRAGCCFNAADVMSFFLATIRAAYAWISEVFWWAHTKWVFELPSIFLTTWNLQPLIRKGWGVICSWVASLWLYRWNVMNYVADLRWAYGIARFAALWALLHGRFPVIWNLAFT